MTAQKPRVVVTGLGVVAPNGHGKEAFQNAIYEGQTGIRYIERLKELKFGSWVGGIPQGMDEKKHDYFRDDELVCMNESIVYSSIAAIDAFKDAGMTPTDPDGEATHDDTGAIVGTGIGGLDTFANIVYPKVAAGKVKRLGSTIVEQIMASGISAKIGGKLGLGNQVTTNSSACSTGTEAIIMGFNRIQAGLAKRMLVGGSEGSDPHIWCGFDGMKVLSKKFNDTPERASRPMSESAAGFVAGSGAGILVIEELQTALDRGATIYAEIKGAAVNSGGMRNGGTITAPSPQGVQQCVRLALKDAGLTGKDVDYINGHLTATMADPMEVGNWSKSLERGPGDFPHINSTKSMIGHALGASGAIECVATVLQLHKQFVHGSLNCEDIHPGVAPFEKSVVKKSIETSLDVAAKASFGFGDVNSCIIFKKWKG